MAEGISNDGWKKFISGKIAGATGGKISGAGGGGFMIFYCPGNTKYKVMQNLENLEVIVKLSVCGTWFENLDNLILLYD